jgi:Clr5 domain
MCLNDEYDTDVRSVSGFFFPSGTARRIYLKKDKIQQVLKHLEHSFQATKQQFQTR